MSTQTLTVFYLGTKIAIILETMDRIIFKVKYLSF